MKYHTDPHFEYWHKQWMLLFNERIEPSSINLLRDLFSCFKASAGQNIHFQTYYTHPSERAYIMAWTFANVPISPDDASKIEEWFKKHYQSAFDAMTDAMGGEYSVKLSWVDNSNAFCASMTPRDETSVNKRSTLTAWSDDPSEAFVLLAYKHIVLSDRGKWNVAKNTARWG